MSFLACSNGELRLEGGAQATEGRVEICVNNTWGTVCDDGWGTNDASVVCRQLGFSPVGAQAAVRALFGAGSGPIYLDNVNCAGGEPRLISCSANPIGEHNCVHSEDAGVRCIPAETPSPSELHSWCTYCTY